MRLMYFISPLIIPLIVISQFEFKQVRSIDIEYSRTKICCNNVLVNSNKNNLKIIEYLVESNSLFDTLLVKYIIPGNQFVYWSVGHIHGGNYWDTVYTTEVLYDTINYNDKLFYKLSAGGWENSNSSQLFFLEGGEELVCDFTWNMGDTIHLGSENCIVEEKGTELIFNESVPFMKVAIYNVLWQRYLQRKIFKKFGIIEQLFNQGINWSSQSLIGARINGIYYGYSTSLITYNPSNLNYYLEQNYPNPFNPTTTISYQLSKTGNVNIKVFDVLGREVATLVNEEKPAGIYKVEFNGSALASGFYYYQLKAGDYIETKKMILVK